MPCGRHRQLLLALEMMKERTLGHTRGMAEIIHRGRRISLATNHEERRIQKLLSGIGWTRGGYRCIHEKATYQPVGMPGKQNPTKNKLPVTHKLVDISNY
jgi:hypothetical protein